MLLEKFGAGSYSLLRKKRVYYQGKSEVQTEMILYLLQNGFNFSEIAKLSDKSHETIRQMGIKDGLKLQMTNDPRTIQYGASKWRINDKIQNPKEDVEFKNENLGINKDISSSPFQGEATRIETERSKNLDAEEQTSQASGHLSFERGGNQLGSGSLLKEDNLIRISQIADITVRIREGEIPAEKPIKQIEKEKIGNEREHIPTPLSLRHDSGFVFDEEASFAGLRRAEEPAFAKATAVEEEEEEENKTWNIKHETEEIRRGGVLPPNILPPNKDTPDDYADIWNKSLDSARNDPVPDGTGHSPEPDVTGQAPNQTVQSIAPELEGMEDVPVPIMPISEGTFLSFTDLEKKEDTKPTLASLPIPKSQSILDPVLFDTGHSSGPFNMGQTTEPSSTGVLQYAPTSTRKVLNGVLMILIISLFSWGALAMKSMLERGMLGIGKNEIGQEKGVNGNIFNDEGRITNDESMTNDENPNKNDVGAGLVSAQKGNTNGSEQVTGSRVGARDDILNQSEQGTMDESTGVSQYARTIDSFSPIQTTKQGNDYKLSLNEKLCRDGESYIWNETENKWQCKTTEKLSNNDFTDTTPTQGNILIASGYDWKSIKVTGDILMSQDGITTIQPDSIALKTDTTGNYVQSITSGSGIQGATQGEGTDSTLELGPLTKDWNQTGEYDITLNNANSHLRMLESNGDTYYGTLAMGDLNQNSTYTFAGTSGTLLTTANYSSTLDPVYVNQDGDTMTGTLFLPTDGLFVGGNQLIVAGGNVGVNTGAPGSKLSIKGNVSIGSNYAGVSAPANGLVVEGKMGIGSASPTNQLSILGTADISDRVGINTAHPTEALDVNGNILIAGGGTIDTRSAGTLVLGGATQTGLTLGRNGAVTTICGLSLVVNPTSWTATPTISGLITATSGLTANGLITGNAGLIINGTTNITGLANINTAGTNASNIGNSTGILTLTSGGASGWTNTAGNLGLTTTTSGNINVNSAGNLNLNTTSNSAINTGTGLTTLGGNLKTNGTATVAGTTTLNGNTTVNANTTLNGTTTTINSTATTTINSATTTLASTLISLTGASPVLNNTSGTLYINTTNNNPVTFGTGNVTIPNLVASSVSTGNILPLLDDTYDIGSSALRYRDLYLGPTSLHVYSNASETTTARDWKLSIQETNGASEGNLRIMEGTNEYLSVDTSGKVGIGNVAPSYKLDVNGDMQTTGGTYLATNSGNVGIGTTNPTHKFEVNGQCVTGDTKLVERGKKKKRESKEIRIDEVKGGEEILSLDEKTGQLVPRKIKGLLDMGVKPIYQLETEDGKKIRTTGNHPYFAIKQENAPENQKSAMNADSLAGSSLVQIPDLSICNNCSEVNEYVKSYNIRNVEVGGIEPPDPRLTSRDPHQATPTLERSYQEEMKNANWTKVVYLKEGDRIAVVEEGEKLKGENEYGETEFAKIKKITELPPEQVWDIEVEGTHNFVGNGIIAHNTYITGQTDIIGNLSSSGNTTVGTGNSTTNTFGAGNSTTNSIGSGTSSVNTIGSGSSSINTIGSTTTPGTLTMHGATTLDNTFIVSGNYLTNLGGNLTVSGTNWTATPTISGLITATSGITSNGLITANLGANVSGAVINLNASSNFATNINTGTSTGAITIGSGLNLISIDSSDWDISNTGSLTGISGISNDGAYTQTGTSANTFTGTSTFSNATYSALFTGGNVGIGTAVPGVKLQVVGQSGTGNTGVMNITGYDQFGQSLVMQLPSTGYTGNLIALMKAAGGSGQAMGFSTHFTADAVDRFSIMNHSGTENLTVLDTGNVGIGTTNPAYKLDVNGDGRFTGALTVGGTLTATGNILPSADNTYALGDATHRWSDLFLGPASLKMYNSYTDASNYELGQLSFNSNVMTLSSTALGTGTTRALQIKTGSNTGMYMDTSGNVGIGTTAPGTTLSVAGSANIGSTYALLGAPANGLAIEGNVGIGTTAPGQKLDVQGGNINTSGNLLASGVLTVSGTGNSSIAGNVGIGTTAPGTALHVVRDTTATTNGFVVTEAQLVLANASIPTEQLHVGYDSSLGTNGSGVIASARSGVAFTPLLLNPSSNPGDGGNVGIGNTRPGSVLGVNGGISAGTYYATAAPSGGMIISGNVGIGTASPGSKLDVEGGGSDVGVMITPGSGSGNAFLYLKGYNGGTAHQASIQSNYLGGIVMLPGGGSGDTSVTIGGSSPINANVLNLYGGAAIGSGYVTTAAPSNGLIVQGNVGIGTASPGAALDVQAATAHTKLTSTTGTNYAYSSIINTGGEFYFGRENSAGGGLLSGDTAYAGIVAAAGTNPLQFGVNNAVSMTLLNGGNVGIGTTVPSYKLSVVSASGTAIAQIKSGDASGATLYFENSSAYLGQLYMTPTGSYLDYPGTLNFRASGNMKMSVDASGNVLQTGNLTVQGTGNTTIAGNVGIGTTAPGQKLDVQGGNINTSGNLLASGVLTVSGTGNTTIAGNVGIGTTAPGTTLSVAGSANIGSTYALLGAPANGLAIEGNVGIGTTSPGAKLDINIPNSGTNYLLAFSDSVGGTADIARFQYNADTSPNSLVLNMNATGNYARPFSIIGGNVGIGTTGPRSSLEISGDETLGYTKKIKWEGSVAGNYYAGVGISGNNYLSLYGVNGVHIGASSTGAEDGKLFVRSDGNVGIGTTSPTDKLFVQSDNPFIQVADSDFTIYNAGIALNTGGGPWNIMSGFSSGTNSNINIAYNGKTSAQSLVTVATNGNVGIGTTDPGTYKLKINGTGYLNDTGWTYSSDQRLKENISYLENSTKTGTNSLDKIMKLQPARYDYIIGNKNQLGFIAQDVQKVIPEAVSITDPTTGTLGLKTDFIIPYLVGAAQEQNIQVESLKGQVASLNVRMASVENINTAQDASLTALDQKLQELEDSLSSSSSSSSDTQIPLPTAPPLGQGEEINPVNPEILTYIDQKFASLDVAGKLQGETVLTLNVGNLTVLDSAVLAGNVEIKGQIALNEDTVGEAKILSGATRVRITFTTPYLYQPIITATQMSFIVGQYKVSEVTTEGFTIEMSEVQTEDTTLSWHAFASDGGKMFVSDGTKQEIQIITAPPAQSTTETQTTPPSDTTGTETTPVEDITGQTSMVPVQQ